MTKGRLVVLVVVVVLISAFFALDVGQYFTLASLKAQQAQLDAYVADNPVVSATVYFLIYVSVTALSLPGAAIMTLAAGAIFGLLWGLVIVSFASTIGATLAMIVARYVLRGQVEKRFSRQIARIDEGIEKEGGFYLFTLRLVPIFPFFLINLVMGLTRMSVPVFFLVSQVGMLAGTIVYINAGTQISQIESLADIASLELLASFTLLGLFPLIAKKIVDVVRANRVYRGYDRPARFDRDVIVIGAGSGGLVASLIVGTVNGKVTLVEKNRMGGDCLNTGCVPSKSLIRSAKLASEMRRAGDYGLGAVTPDVRFDEVMARVRRVIRAIEPHDSVERYEQELGVDVEIGEGRIVSPWVVEVNGKSLTTRNIIIATGASPFVPPIRGIESVDYLTSDNLWELETRPDRLVVLGGGPIGTELSQGFSRLGSRVTQVEALDRIMVREDPDISAMVKASLLEEGVDVVTGYLAEEVVVEGREKLLVTRNKAGDIKRIPFDELLVAVGRKANVTGFGLEEIGVDLAPQGTVKVDDYLRTNFPNIFAIGDAAGPYQFTHTASHMAWYAAVNALFGTFWKFRVDYSVIPWSTFCSPEVARVGINETEAMQAGMDVEVTTFDVAELDRALADEEARGLVKVLTPRDSDKILGVTIVADHAGDLISEFVLAMKHDLGLGKIMGTIHIYPTLAEMNKFAASEWRKKHKPEGLLEWVGRFHSWRRGQGFRYIPGY